MKSNGAGGASGWTIRDVAARAGVSTATVSRALNGAPSVKPDVRARVLAAARDLGYTPNGIARSLRTQRTGTIGLLLRDVANTNFSLVCKGAQDVAAARGYNVLVGSSEGDPAREREFIDALLRRRVDGLILYVADEERSESARVRAQGIPVVLVESRVRGLATDQVLCDNAGGARAAVARLLGLGHRRIDILAGTQTRTPGREKLRGYVEAYQGAGLRHDERWIHGVSDLDARARARLLGALRGDGAPTAVFCATAHLTIEFLKLVRDAGIRVPDDLSVIGFDNAELAGLLSPPLTAVERDLQRIGADAASLLLDRMTGEAGGRPRRITVPMRLVDRASCRAITPRPARALAAARP
jgi:LacI family transcriptional regulator